MSFPPPPVTPREGGGVTLHGLCAGTDGGVCQLVVFVLDNGMAQLCFHGTEQHSITLTAPQRDALADLLIGRKRDRR